MSLNEWVSVIFEALINVLLEYSVWVKFGLSAIGILMVLRGLLLATNRARPFITTGGTSRVEMLIFLVLGWVMLSLFPLIGSTMWTFAALSPSLLDQYVPLPP